MSKTKDEAGKGSNVLAGIVFSLLSLLMSFSFSLAVTRFEATRHILVEEANAIGTASLRVGLLTKADQPAIRTQMAKYADARLAFGEALANGDDTTKATAETHRLQATIWSAAMDSMDRASRESTRNQVTPALNQMFDIAATRQEAASTRLPGLIFLLLGVSSIASAILGGRALAGRTTRSWGHRIICSAVLAFVVYVIVDLDDPRQGLIRVDKADQMLRDVRASMH